MNSCTNSQTVQTLAQTVQTCVRMRVVPLTDKASDMPGKGLDKDNPDRIKV
jgi:hypothetical protein